jgi:MoaA/NifB/PqqE/SkfB family radical SAM enzyme
MKMTPTQDTASFCSEYSTRRSGILPRLPLKGNLDLTYRCNFNCRHCWLRIPPGASERRDELSLEEIRTLVDESRARGCREWAISGGEPLLRPDFSEIFDYLTRKTANYFLNTNGSLITPETAQLLRRRGIKMVALYGATPEIHDHVTRTPGSFDSTMRGFSYLQESGAGFIVQLIPMRANSHQWDAMLALAQSLSPHWRVGASWLYLSSTGSEPRNAEINAQRLSPKDVIRLDPPQPQDQRPTEEILSCSCAHPLTAGPGQEFDDRLFARCIEVRRDFHVDPYGKMTFCSFIKDPSLRYDLRRGTFQEAWEEFIPSLADRVRGGDEYRNSCGSCEQRADCRWCPVYAYLENGRFSAPVSYLCEVAAEARKFKMDWRDKHRCYFQLAGITICVESDLDFDTVDFKQELKQFAVAGPGDDNIRIRHHLGLPDIKGKDLGEELYRKAPWAISRRNGTWYYLGISPKADDPELHRIAVFNADYTEATIYSPASDETRLRQVGFQSLSLFPTDQIWIAPLLADRNAALFHSAAAILNGQGFLFVGHSEAGKSTTMNMLKGLAGTGETSDLSIEILCDDRNAVRRWDTGWRVHGTWSHGDVDDVSPASAPLRAVLFLQQAQDNEIVPLTNRKEIWKRLLATLIKPMVTAEWWQKELDVLEQMVSDVPCYTMRFDKSGRIAEALIHLATPHNRDEK